MAATQVQVHIRSTRSPSSSRTTRATAQTPSRPARRGRCPPAAAAGPASSVRARVDPRDGAEVSGRSRGTYPGTIVWHAVAAHAVHAAEPVRRACIRPGQSPPGSPHAREVPPSRPGRHPSRRPGADSGTPADVVAGDRDRAPAQRRPAGAAEERAGPLLRGERPPLDDGPRAARRAHDLLHDGLHRGAEPDHPVRRRHQRDHAALRVASPR